jgi:ribonuclease HI
MAQLKSNLPIWVETDGVWSRNTDDRGPGGLEAGIATEDHDVELCGPKPDTFNNEMEWMAMHQAIELTPEHSCVIVKSYSQTCIHSVTKYRRMDPQQRMQKSSSRCPD